MLAAVLGTAACDRKAEPVVRAEAPPSPVAQPAAARVPPGAQPFHTTEFKAGAGAKSKRGIKGTLEAFPSQPNEPNGVYVRVRLAGLRPGTHAWHIHNGPCSDIGRVIVALTPADTMQGIAQPIVADSAGTAEQTAFVLINALSRKRMELRAYSVRVHVPEGDHTAPSEACARL